MRRLLTFFLACIPQLGCGKAEVSPAPERPSNPATTLEPDALEEIATLVRTGFYDKDRLREIVCEEMYAPGELNSDVVSAVIDSQLANIEAEKRTWPDVTDCDRLDAAYAAMNRRGIIAIQNAGYTQSDGYDSFREAYDSHPHKSSVIGYCFYHAQDVLHALHDKEMYVAFGPVNSSNEETEGVVVGEIVREELERAGLEVEWDGTFASRLKLPNILWQRR